MALENPNAEKAKAILEVRDLYVGYYADLHILRGLNLAAEKGKLTTILGANGVGSLRCSRRFMDFSGHILARFSSTGATSSAHQHIN